MSFTEGFSCFLKGLPSLLCIQVHETASDLIQTLNKTLQNVNPFQCGSAAELQTITLPPTCLTLLSKVC